jgi:hypothetical protein
MKEDELDSTNVSLTVDDVFNQVIARFQLPILTKIDNDVLILH